MKTSTFKTLLCILCFGCSALLAFGQENNNWQKNRERQQNMDITEVYNRMATRLAKQMKLKDDDKDKFTVLYLDYQNARHNAVNPKGGDQETNEANTDLKKLTDEQAKELIEKNFARQEKQLAVDREYLSKFLEFLTPSQAVYIFVRTNPGRQNGSGRMPMGGPMGGGRPMGGPMGSGF